MDSLAFPPSPSTAGGGSETGLSPRECFVPKLEAGAEDSARAVPSEAGLASDTTIRRRSGSTPDPRRQLLIPSAPSPISSPSPSPPSSYDEDVPTSPTFVDAFTKIRNLSSELFQYAGDTLQRGYIIDPAKVEHLSQEIAKTARIITCAEADERRRLPPPLVRPRRIRRKHSDEEDFEEADKRRKVAGVTTELYCHSCGTTDTPEWRRGPDGCKSLCNACGLHYAKILRRETMIPNRQPARTTMTLNNLLN